MLAILDNMAPSDASQCDFPLTPAGLPSKD